MQLFDVKFHSVGDTRCRCGQEGVPNLGLSVVLLVLHLSKLHLAGANHLVEIRVGSFKQ